MAKSVLVIDDEPGIMAALITRLEANGYHVYSAVNGLTGVEAAELYQPDVIVLDIRMPDISGFEVCARIKQLPGLKKIPIVFLSADLRESSQQRALDVGGTEFLSKPYEAADVIAAIERVTEEPINLTVKEF